MPTALPYQRPQNELQPHHPNAFLTRDPQITSNSEILKIKIKTLVPHKISNE